MIQFRDLTLARGAKVLIEHASIQIHAGWRVGLTGANGSGKSSLFAALRGELHAEHGDCEVPAAWRIASVAQETPALDTPAIDYVLDGDAELRAIERDLTAAEAAHDGHLLGELHARLGDIDGYGARARAAALLDGLGFSQRDLERPVAEFSGGWRMRLNLAQALLSRADLLLLDEPTNHLDLEAVVWLEQWLTGFRGTLVLVSHDREFLDGCVTHIANIHAATLTLYTGNYSAFEETRAMQLAVQQALYEKQQRAIAHMTSFVERFRAKATKARQAQSRLKALARMEKIAAAHVDTPFDFAFATPAASPNILISLDEASTGYEDQQVLSGITFDFLPGSRIGLLGPNGAGKSTFVKLLSGELAPLAGERREGRGLAIGYFAQHQLEQLREDESPIRHLLRLEPRTREQVLRDYLGGFNFRGTMADAPVASFSGGERSRLALALIVRRRPNLLLLDEPTNHLDIDMRQALTQALAEYEGSLVLVSHDRALLRSTCDEFLLVADGGVTSFDGDLDDYVRWLAARRAKPDPAKPAATLDKSARRESRGNATAGRQDRIARRRPLMKEIETLERDIARWQAEKKTVDAELADPAFYASPDPAKLKQRTLRQQQLAQDIEAAEQRWLDAQAELEDIGTL